MNVDLIGAGMAATATGRHIATRSIHAAALRRHRRDMQVAYRLGFADGRRAYQRREQPEMVIEDLDIVFDPGLSGQRRRDREELLWRHARDRGHRDGWQHAAEHDIDRLLHRLVTA